MHERVIKAGGLHVIGTERHESRRIDNQLRGRSGRQGDPGSSRFYLSLEDDLMRIFGGEQISSLMDRLKLPEEQPIENSLVSRAIEQAQVKVEGFNFDIRKNLVEYDDVANQQRDIVYKLRRRVLDSENLKDEVQEKLSHQIDRVLLLSYPADGGKLDSEKTLVGLLEMVPFDDKSKEAVRGQIDKLKDKEEAREFLVKVVEDIYQAREKQAGGEMMRQVEKFAYLSSIDRHWIDHIDYVDGLREGVRLRGYAQKDPLVEFKNEAYNAFEGLMDRVDGELARRIFRIGVSQRPAEIPLDAARENVDKTDAIGLAQASADATAREGTPAFAQGTTSSSTPNFSGPTNQVTNQQITKKKIGRNDPCWCGSGKKWKKCHYPQLG